jgi:hypothetical protein
MYYGFLAVLIASHIKSRFKRYVYYPAFLLILLVAFSRVYLGAHWLTDVSASFFIGFTFLALITISYRRKIAAINIVKTALVIISITFIVWLVYFIYAYPKNVLRYSLNWPSQVIAENAWWGQVNPAVPIFRQNRIGQPDEPMNIQYSGEITQLKRILSEEGWNVSPNITLIKKTINKLSQPETSITPLLPSLYLNKPPILMMTKEEGHVKLVLKFWTSNVYISESWDVIYVGNITEYKLKSEDKIIYSYNTISRLIPFLKVSDWRLALVNAELIPYKLFTRKWNGEILQISAPTLY